MTIAPPLRPEDVDRRATRFVAATSLSAFATLSRDEPWLTEAFDEAVLSQDTATGECSSVLTIPACGRGPAGSFAAATEFFVLEGSLGIGDRTLERFGYACVPGGAVDGPYTSERGARVAVFTSGPRRFQPGPQAAVGPVLPAIAHLDARQEQWQQTAPTLPGVLPPGLMVKPLMENPDTGAITFLSGNLMRWTTRPAWESHPHFEEQLYLEGEFDQLEVLEAGRVAIHYEGPGYSFRPAGVDHLGPGCGTASYCLRVVRVPSRLTNVYNPQPRPYPDGYLPSVLRAGT